MQYGKDVLDWTERAVLRIHEETGMLVIPNYSDMDMGDPQVLQVTNITDGILAESGFTMWNPIPNTTSMHHLPLMTNPEKFEKQVAFVRNLQRHGKGFFSINEWGPGPVGRRTYPARTSFRPDQRSPKLSRTMFH